jgi:transmembrane serine protease 9
VTTYRRLRTLLVSLSLTGLAGCAATEASAPTTDDASEIVSGHAVTQAEYTAEYPWLLSMSVIGPDDGFIHHCGAELIAPDVVLTAAHCLSVGEGGGDFIFRASDLVFGRGDVDRRDLGKPGEGRTKFRARSVHRHPAYDPETLDFDVAVIHLAEPQPGPFARLADDRVAPGATVRAIGWGDTGRRRPNGIGQHDMPDQLQRASLQISDTAACRETYSAMFNKVTRRMVCASGVGLGDDGKTSSICQGDSGGPLLVEGPDGLALAGVTSWLQGCGTKKFPSVFARIDGELRGWIDLCAADAAACAIGPH